MHKNLLAERKAKRLSQKTTAEAIGISEGTYRRKELGQSQFDLNEAQALSEFLGIPIDVLFPEFFLKKE